MTKIGILGFGKMGEAIGQGLQRQSSTAKSFSIQGVTRTAASAKEIGQRLSIPCGTSSETLVGEVDVVLLCVKPHQAEKVLRAVAGHFKKDQVLISVCASLTTEQLSQWSGGQAAVIRAMPNTPCLIGQGMTVFCAGPGAKDQDLALAKDIFGTLGKTALIEESLMDGATGLSGCGPA
jgi:pyrroline-5-carboxylate reductase